MNSMCIIGMKYKVSFTEIDHADKD